VSQISALPGRPAEAAPLTVTVTDQPSPAALAQWRQLVASSPDGDVAQLPEWAGLRATVGFQVRYVLVHAGPGGELLGGAQILERPLPLLGRVGYLPYGPLIAEGRGAHPAVSAALCAALTELGHTRLRMLFVQPPAAGEAISRELRHRGFRDSEANIAPRQTLRLDLTRELSALRGGLSKRLRTWNQPVGVSGRHGPPGHSVRRAGVGRAAGPLRGAPGIRRGVRRLPEHAAARPGR
jgi:hypothetical protein